MMRALWTTLFVAALAAPSSHAGQTWTFDVSTTGQDVSWTSPTSVDPSASVYAISYKITQVLVDVTWGGFPFNNIDVTNQVPPELQSATVEVPGPAPVAAVNQPIVVPPPPTAPAFSATLSMGLNASGAGYASATNVTLGTLVVNLPIFGNQTVTLTKVRLVGSLNIHAAWYDLGQGLSGSTGVPSFVGAGPLVAGQPLTLTLSGAPASRTTLFVVGVTQINAPFFGGTMVPSLNVIAFLATNASGQMIVPATWPAGVPAGTSIYMQCWVLNGAGNSIDAGSNALRAVAQ